MDLSVIIINWNSKKYLYDCIESIIETVSRINYEIIVIDNNSTDKVFSELKVLSDKIMIIENPENVGFSRAIAWLGVLISEKAEEQFDKLCIDFGKKIAKI